MLQAPRLLSLLGFLVVTALVATIGSAADLKMVPHSGNGSVTGLEELPYQKTAEWSIITDDMKFHTPKAVVVNTKGLIHVADSSQRVVVVLNPDGSLNATWKGEPDGTRMAAPSSLAFDGIDTIYVGDEFEAKVFIYKNGQFTKLWNLHGDGEGKTRHIGALCVGPSGHVFIADQDRDKIMEFSSDGRFLKEIGVSGDAKGQLFGPAGLYCDMYGYLWITDLNHYVHKFGTDGTHIKRWGGPGTKLGNFKNPRAILLDSQDRVFVADSENSRIQRLSLSESADSKALSTEMSWGDTPQEKSVLSRPSGIAILPDNTVIVADPHRGTITFWKQVAPPSEEPAAESQTPPSENVKPAAQ